ncbi:MAG: hypothetical protein ACRDHK_00040 [Actinomycetota bacterium]
MSDLVIRRFDQPDESTSLTRGKLDMLHVAGLTPQLCGGRPPVRARGGNRRSQDRR